MPRTQGQVNVSINPVINQQAWNRIARSFPLGRISGDISQFQSSLDAAAARTTAFAVSAGALAGTANLVRNVVTAFVDVEDALVNINSIFQLSQRDLGQFGKTLFTVARNTATSFSEASEAAQEFARQGLSVVETSKRVEAALTLAKLSGLSVTESTQSLTAALNGFSKEGLTAIEIVDKLATVDAAFAVSSADLAAGLSRVGDTAQSAGVGLDQLLASVAAIQQRTARGGPVIANGLKSIFTRLQRSGVQDTLNAIGVQTQDANGEFRSAIDVLEDYAKVYGTLSDAQRAYTDEQIAGLYQINTLKAFVADLSSETGAYARARDIAAQSDGQAKRRLDELTKSTKALGQQTLVSLTEAGSNLGKNLFGDLFTGVLGTVGDVAAVINKAFDEDNLSTGAKVLRRIVEDIGNFISGPGLVGAVFLMGKLFGRMASDVLGAAKTAAFMGSRLENVKSLQGQINAFVQNDVQLQQRLLSLGSNRLAQQATLLNYMKQQAAFQSQMAALGASVVPAVAKRASFSGKGQSLKVTGYRAGGYVNTMPEQMMINEGVGGARPSDKPSVIKNFNYGGGKKGTVVANTGEWMVPNFGGGSAIFNRDMVKQYGLPDGAKKINAAGGYVPNFARPNLISTRIVGDGSYGEFGIYKKRPTIGFKNIFEKKNIANEYNAAQNAYERLKDNQIVTAPKVLGSLSRSLERGRIGKEVVQSGDFTNITKYLPKGQSSLPISTLANFGFREAARSGIKVDDDHLGNIGLKSGDIEGFIKDFTGDFRYKLSSIKKAFKTKRFSTKKGTRMLYKGQLRDIHKMNKGAISRMISEDILKNKEKRLLNIIQKNKVRTSIIDPADHLAGGYVPNFANLKSAKYGSKSRISKTDAGSYLTYGLNGGQIDLKYINSLRKGDGYKLFSRLTNVSKRTKKPISSNYLDIQDGYKKPITATQDNLLSAFPQIRYRMGKGSHSGTMVAGGDIMPFNSIDEILSYISNNRVKLNELEFKNILSSYAGGYAPLSKAIAREASVRPLSSVRINQSPSLASGTNPFGLAVTNTIDEPRGLSDVPNRGKGYVPNFAKKDPVVEEMVGSIKESLQEIKIKNRISNSRPGQERKGGKFYAPDELELGARESANEIANRHLYVAEEALKIEEKDKKNAEQMAKISSSNLKAARKHDPQSANLRVRNPRNNPAAQSSLSDLDATSVATLGFNRLINPRREGAIKEDAIRRLEDLTVAKGSSRFTYKEEPGKLIGTDFGIGEVRRKIESDRADVGLTNSTNRYNQVLKAHAEQKATEETEEEIKKEREKKLSKPPEPLPNFYQGSPNIEERRAAFSPISRQKSYENFSRYNSSPIMDDFSPVVSGNEEDFGGGVPPIPPPPTPPNKKGGGFVGTRKQLQARLAKQNKTGRLKQAFKGKGAAFGNFALASSFLLPSILGGISGDERGDPEGSTDFKEIRAKRKNDRISEIGTSTLQSAVTGGALGASFGPWGAVIGAVGGAAVGLVSSFTKTADSLEDLSIKQSIYSNEIKKAGEQLATIDVLTNAKNALSEAEKSGDKNSIIRARRNFSEVTSQSSAKLSPELYAAVLGGDEKQIFKAETSLRNKALEDTAKLSIAKSLERDPGDLLGANRSSKADTQILTDVFRSLKPVIGNFTKEKIGDLSGSQENLSISDFSKKIQKDISGQSLQTQDVQYLAKALTEISPAFNDLSGELFDLTRTGRELTNEEKEVLVSRLKSIDTAISLTDAQNKLEDSLVSLSKSSADARESIQSKRNGFGALASAAVSQQSAADAYKTNYLSVKSQAANELASFGRVSPEFARGLERQLAEREAFTNLKSQTQSSISTAADIVREVPGLESLTTQFDVLKSSNTQSFKDSDEQIKQFQILIAEAKKTAVGNNEVIQNLEKLGFESELSNQTAQANLKLAAESKEYFRQLATQKERSNFSVGQTKESLDKTGTAFAVARRYSRTNQGGRDRIRGFVQESLDDPYVDEELKTKYRNKLEKTNINEEINQILGLKGSGSKRLSDKEYSKAFREKFAAGKTDPIVAEFAANKLKNLKEARDRRPIKEEDILKPPQLSGSEENLQKQTAILAAAEASLKAAKEGIDSAVQLSQKILEENEKRQKEMMKQAEKIATEIAGKPVTLSGPATFTGPVSVDKNGRPSVGPGAPPSTTDASKKAGAYGTGIG